MKNLLYIDMAYTAQAMRLRQQGFWEARNSGGYFDRVWALHPIADRVVPGMQRTEIHRLAAGQIQIEGQSAACRLPGALAPLNFWLSQRALFNRLRRYFSKRGTSLVYATDALYGGLFAYFMARRLRCPLIIAVWGNWDDQWNATRTLAMPRLIPSKRIQDMIIRFVLRRADRVVVGNRNNFDYVAAHGAYPERISIVSTSKFLFADHFSDPVKRRSDRSILAELGLPLDARPLIHVGRLVPEKLPDQALDAMISAAHQDRSIYGLFAGDGALREKMQAHIDAEGLTDRIRLLGALSQSDLARLLPHCTVISPLTGMALIEAGLAGAPIVAYAHEWQTEFIDDGRNGYLVPPGDTHAMADKAIALLRDAETANVFSEAIRDHAMKIADRDLIYAAEREMYDEVIARFSAGARS